MVKMSEAAREAKRAYMREWQRQNRDKVKNYQARYWEQKAQEYREQDGQPREGQA